MKFTRVLLLLGFMSLTVLSKAQTSAQNEISDEDLKKYAITMDSVDAMKKTLHQMVTDEVQNNTVMSVTRYNELFKIVSDEAKLKEANATPEEIAFLKEVDAKRELNIERINAAYQAMAKDYVGAKAFNAIHKGLKSDAALKARYDNISKEVQSASQSGKKDSGD